MPAVDECPGVGPLISTAVVAAISGAPARHYRSTYHYRSKPSGQAVLMKRIEEIAETRVRYGYRRIHVLRRREGWLVNIKRVCRLYREMGLQLRNKSPKRRVKTQRRDDRAPATAPTKSGPMDFVHDQLFAF